MIRAAMPTDAADLLAIYAPYVRETLITFEYTVPTQAVFAQRIRHTLDNQYPYLVAEERGTIVGYAYASAFHPRAAYQWTAELSVYVSLAAHGRGIGRQLYAALEAALIAQGVVQAVACIAYPATGSITFHEKMGYQQVAHFKQVGYKFAQWVDVVWMQKQLQPVPEELMPRSNR